jgi:UDP-N-acetylmuramate dehydrogenase
LAARDPQPKVPLAPLTTLGIGGAARHFAPARSLDEVAEAHRWAAEKGLPLFVLGGGSNLVIADAGFDGLVLQMDIRGIEFRLREGHTFLRAGAGEPWDGVVAGSVARGLVGLESLSGIPGSVGGTPVQNVGAYGQEVRDTIEQVICFDRETASVVTLSNSDCGFAYRTSRFKREDAGRFVVCEVIFRLRSGTPAVTYPDVISYFAREMVGTPSVVDARAAILEIRRRKGMVLDPDDADTRSVGSFFMNPVVPAGVHARIASGPGGSGAPGFVLPDGVKIPAAWLIEHAGFAKGYYARRVGLSTKHPLAIVNRGGATAREVVELAVRIKQEVVRRFGVWLRPEPVFVGFGEDPDVAYLQRASG